MRTKNDPIVARFHTSQSRVLIPQKERRNRSFGLCCALFVCAAAAGALLAGARADTLLLEYIGYLVKTSLQDSAGGGFLRVFIQSLIGAGALLGLFYIFSLCALGIPLLLALLALCGVGIGLTCGYVYVLFGLRGALVNLLVLLPCDILLALAYVASACAGIPCAAAAYAVFMKEGAGNVAPAVRQLSRRISSSLLLIVAAALVRALCFLIFRGFFS
ncbi:MAG: hypothetical protein VB021_07715 [Oscillospiraceae bacterium]|nr:hypothetical protein [Oscillospiraceae bacterium]